VTTKTTSSLTDSHCSSFRRKPESSSLHCATEIVCVGGNRRRDVAVASAAGCRPNGAPCGAARGRRKSPKDGAQDARQFAACTRTCIQRTPEPAREPGGQDARKARHRGCVSLVTFFAQAKKVTRSPQASGSSALENSRIKMDSRLRGNDGGHQRHRIPALLAPSWRSPFGPPSLFARAVGRMTSEEKSHPRPTLPLKGRAKDDSGQDEGHAP
jgi:hypothetical protein